MQKIKLYDWNDTELATCLREVQVGETQDLTRNGKTRIWVWAQERDEFNYILYPDFQTAYPEHDNRVQMQRHAERYRYEAVD